MKKAEIMERLEYISLGEELENKCRSAYENGDRLRLLELLRGYRKNLLGKIHGEQQKLDDLDYLLFKLKKEFGV